MVFSRLSAHTSVGTPARASLRRKRLRLVAVTTLGLALAFSAFCWAQPSPAPMSDAGNFFRSIVGEWIGVCEQSTDGEPAENKYFHAVIEQVDDNSFSGEFKYYRYDEATGTPIHIGDASIKTSVQPDETARNDIAGHGTILVNDKPKPQEHQLVEILSPAGEGSLAGQITGKISVGGMPLGLGKNGSVHSGSSIWTLDDGILTIRQSIKAGFRVVFFSKSYTIDASSTASRGSDVVSLMKKTRVAVRQTSQVSEEM